MKQVLQSLNNGVTELVDIPCPSVHAGRILIRTNCSLISPGTERMLIEFGKAGLIEKIRKQPEKFHAVLNKIKTDGLLPTFDSVYSKLGEPIPLGYSNVGEVLQIGEGVTEFSVGDRVVSNGHHAEVVSVPVNLCARIPSNVEDESAAFTIVGAIALQGIRLANPSLGEAIVVTGLGLIGQLTVQLLLANGCRVLGIDFDQDKLDIAKSLGAEVVNLGSGEDPLRAANIFSRGRGVDAVLITASTQSNKPMQQAAMMSRNRGRIILVGVTGLELSRDEFYKKELTFQVSSSYGPGRHDRNYEEKGQDYPVGFVRWTQQRNFEAVLDMLSNGMLNVKPLISHRFNFEQIKSAYAVACNNEFSMGILLNYCTRLQQSDELILKKTIPLLRNASVEPRKFPSKVAFIGAGNYATAVLMPAFKKAGGYLQIVCSNSGVSGTYAANKFGFEESTTDIDDLIERKNIDAIVIATRHNTHADLVLRGLHSGKHIFVEKPLCLTLSELSEIQKIYRSREISRSNLPILMVGFNRRFSPLVQKIKLLLNNLVCAKSFVLTVNAGAISSEHWTQNLEIGGGRIIGEVCHFIDLLRFLAGSPIKGWQVQKMDCSARDTISVQLNFINGSIGTIHYFTNGGKSFPKERLEVFAGGGILQLDNFRKLVGYGWPGFEKMNLWRQDKGQNACVKQFLDSIKNHSSSPIPFEEIFEVSRVTILISKFANKD